MTNGPGSTYRGGRVYPDRVNPDPAERVRATRGAQDYQSSNREGLRPQRRQHSSRERHALRPYIHTCDHQAIYRCHSLFLFFLKKNKPSYAVMRTRNTTTRATPSELRDYAVTLHTHTHACTHTRARLHACAHTHTREARNRVIA